MKDKCHDPGGQGCDKNDDHCVSKSFQAGSHIQFCKVDSAGDKWKTENDEKHRAYISGFMSKRNAEQQFSCF